MEGGPWRPNTTKKMSQNMNHHAAGARLVAAGFRLVGIAAAGAAARTRHLVALVRYRHGVFATGHATSPAVGRPRQ